MKNLLHHHLMKTFAGVQNWLDQVAIDSMHYLVLCSNLKLALTTDKILWALLFGVTVLE